MKPDQSGIWEWFDEDGTKRLVEVYDVMSKIPGEKPYFRVFWWGGYYNVNDEVDDLYNCKGEVVEKGYIHECEWTDSWGVRVGDNQSLPPEQLYLGPTPEEFEEIKSRDERRGNL